MRLLLDTHIFIWWADQQESLSETVLSALKDEANELLLSVASVWEMQIKTQLGKLKLGVPLRELVQSQVETNDLRILPVELAHVLGSRHAPISSQRSVRQTADCTEHLRKRNSGQRRSGVRCLLARVTPMI